MKINNMMKLLVTDKIDEQGLKPLEKYFQIDVKTGLSKEDLEKMISGYNCIITRSATALPREVIEKGEKLKIIARCGIGVDNIDIFAATERRIAVINSPNGNAKVIAEHTIALLFSLFRHIPQASADMKRGIWGKQKYIGTQIFGKTLGIVGFGNVGREVYRIAKGLGLQVVVCEPYVRLPRKVKKVTFEELLASSDVISFHVPMTYLTLGMINRYTVSLCKKGAYIINCSRGGVIEEKAILEALENNRISGLAVDVFINEPKVSSSLLKHPKVIATPHIAGSTTESLTESTGEIVAGICRYIEGKVPSNLLNPQVFRKRISYKKKVRLGFEVIIFDCDSTLSTIEGIDTLGEMVGKKEEIAKLTRMAMDGVLPFEEVFKTRLEIIRPTRTHLLKLGRLYIDNLVTDTKGVIEALHHLGKEVYLVSGGYTAALLELGSELGVPDKNIFGNDLLFDDDGFYQTYIEGPLHRNHGKLQIVRQISGRKMMIGDSITDLETKECVDLFVGFGGIVKRPVVETGSEIYLYTPSISPILVIAAGIDGCLKLLPTKYRKYVGKGIDLLSHHLHARVNSKRNLNFSDLKRFSYIQR